MKIFCKFIVLFFLVFKFALASENIKIHDIENNIFVLDIYGNKYFTNKYNKIQSGDYLKSTNEPAILLMDNNKICFSKNSSIKIKSINKSKKLIKMTLLKAKEWFLFIYLWMKS